VKIDVKSEHGDAQAKDATPPRNSGFLCGRQWHWAELVFILMIPLGVITAVVGFSDKHASIPPLPFAIILLATAAMALAMIWNLATTKKLAETAEALEKTIAQEQQALNDAEIQKKDLERNTAEVRAKLVTLQDSVKLLGGSVQNMAAVEGKLNEIFQQSSASQEKRRSLNREQNDFLRKQQEDTLEREKISIKQRIKDQCEEADGDHDGVIGSGSEVERMKAFLAGSGIAWSDSFDQDGDGKIQIYEVMESLDKILDDHFNALRGGLAKKSTLSRELYDLRWELKSPASPASKTRSL